MSHMNDLNRLIKFGIDENHKQDAMMYAVVCSIAGSLAAIADVAEAQFADSIVKQEVNRRFLQELSSDE